MDDKVQLFNVNEAVKYGINRAIVLNIIRKHTRGEKPRQAKNGNYYYFACISAQSLADEMPYLSRAGIAKILQWLEDKQVIISDNFNKNKYDRTKWYAIL